MLLPRNIDRVFNILLHNSFVVADDNSVLWAWKALVRTFRQFSWNWVSVLCTHCILRAMSCWHRKHKLTDNYKPHGSQTGRLTLITLTHNSRCTSRSLDGHLHQKRHHNLQVLYHTNQVVLTQYLHLFKKSKKQVTFLSLSSLLFTLTLTHMVRQ